MAERFFVEFRPWKRTHIRDYADGANKRLRKSGSEKIEVPHMTLYGPSEAKDLNEIARRIKAVASEYKLVKVKTFEFDYFNNADKKWVVIRVKPNQKLESLRLKLYQSLRTVSHPQPWDEEPTYKFHVSIGKTVRGNVFTRLRHTVNKWVAPEIEQFLLRIAIINGQGKIFKEYDLLLGKLFTRSEALSPRVRSNTLKELRRLLNGSEPSTKSSPAPNKVMAFIKKLFS
jgi:2'-5' RNA ligase